MACAICHTRRPRRFCPGVNGDICSICCGTEREVSIDCPLTCEYLREAHKHEKPQPLSPEGLPNRDVMVDEETVRLNQELVAYLALALITAAVANPAIVDFDIREALDALVRTHRTAQSGLVYETVPTNPLAASVYRSVEEAIANFRRMEAEESGVHKMRESLVLGLLVFLQHFELSFNNGRPRGRAFLDALTDYCPLPAESEPADGGSSLLLP